MKNWKKLLLLIFIFLAGVIIGNVVANATQGLTFLSWLSLGKSIGIGDPAVIVDLAVIELAFGFHVSINLAQIVFIVIGLIVWKRISKGL